MTLVIAHRGASGELPENTLEAFELALNQGADGMELDIVSTKDNQLIVRHDVFLSRSTNVASISKFAHKKSTKIVDGISIEDWFAIDFSLDEIKELKTIQPYEDRPQQYNNQFAIPTLESVIKLVKEFNEKNNKNRCIYFEIKNSSFHKQYGEFTIEKLLMDLLKKEQWDKKNSPAIILSFEVNALKEIRKISEVRLYQSFESFDIETGIYPQPYDFVLNKDTRTYKELISKEGLLEVKKYADGLTLWKGYLLNDKYKISNQELLQISNEWHLPIILWTFKKENLLKNVSIEEEYKQFSQLGIEGIITDYPDFARSLIK